MPYKKHPIPGHIYMDAGLYAKDGHSYVYIGPYKHNNNHLVLWLDTFEIQQYTLGRLRNDLYIGTNKWLLLFYGEGND